MAINLATKYAKQIDRAYTKGSFTAGRSYKGYDFTGVRGIKIYTPQTVDLVDYTANGANRFGTPTEVQDTVQEKLLTQHKAFALTVDASNDESQMNVKAAGRILRMQIEERVNPAIDKHAFAEWAKYAGNVVSGSALTKTNALDAINAAASAMDNALVPDENRFIAVGGTAYGFVRGSSEFIKPDQIGAKALLKGEVGSIFGLNVVKVPDSFLPANCPFIAWHKNAVMAPQKISHTKIHQDPPGIHGHLIEGDWLYDAFVLAQKVGGVYAYVTAGKQATPTIAISSNSATITSSGATAIYYTVDGSDPRFSLTAKPYTGAVAVEAGAVVKAVAYGTFTSDVAEKKNG